MTPEQNRNRILTDYNQRRDQIGSDKKISSDERRRQLATAYVDALDELATVRSKEQGSIGATRKKLEDRYFKAASSAAWMSEAEKVGLSTSLRDALGRASATPDNGLVALIDRAERSGDEIQAKAALQIAFERRDVNAVNKFIEFRPNADVDLNTLWDLTQPITADGISDLREEFRWAPQPPLDLVDERSYRKLADPNFEKATA